MLLRTELANAAKKIDPEGSDPALRNMVLIGHSQGGLLVKMAVIDSGSKFIDVVSKKPLDSWRITSTTRELLRGAVVRHEGERQDRDVGVGIEVAQRGPVAVVQPALVDDVRRQPGGREQSRYDDDGRNGGDDLHALIGGRGLHARRPRPAADHLETDGHAPMRRRLDPDLAGEAVDRANPGCARVGERARRHVVGERRMGSDERIVFKNDALIDRDAVLNLHAIANADPGVDVHVFRDDAVRSDANVFPDLSLMPDLGAWSNLGRGVDFGGRMRKEQRFGERGSGNVRHTDLLGSFRRSGGTASARLRKRRPNDGRVDASRD